MSFYDRTAASALRLITKYGQAVTITEQAPGAYDPATASAAVTATAHAARAAVFDYPEKLVDGTRILTGDKEVLVAASGLAITPAPGMTFTDAAGQSYAVVNAKPLAPAGTAVIHTLQVRK